MVMTKKDVEEYHKMVSKLENDKGPNDLERRIEDLTKINKSHQKLNGDLRAEVLFYKKKAEHYQTMSDQLKKENQEFRQKSVEFFNEFRNKGDM
jgi:uncharacterized protein YlxW (UPF0749 family)|tara:strand:- start:415 stop:696 length:282 start_codon:yes stop_codon:yes gene_type:complete